MRRILFVFSSVFCLFCINLAQAQTPTSGQAAQPATPSPTPVTVPSFNPGNPQGVAQPVQNGTSGAPATGTSSATTSGKFYEYQSYCRAPLEFKVPLSDSEFSAAIEPFKTTFNAKKTFANLEPIIDFLINENRPKEARTLVIENKSLLSLPQDKALQARILTAEKKYRDALAMLDTVTDAAKTDVMILTEYSRVYRKLNNLFEAKSALQDAMKIDKKNPNKYLLDLCVLETEDSNHSEVDVLCNKVMKAFPKDTLGYIYLGISLRERLNYKEAQRLFERATQVEKNEFAYTCLGEVYYLQKNYGKAVEAFKSAAAAEPRSGRAQLGTAQSLYQILRYAEALPYYIKACQLDRSSSPSFREALKPLEAAKMKISTDYYNGLQQCGGRQ